ncbi:hypothetical protein EMIT0P2_120053 [Pseudomonas sp. IT-P2]
MSGRIRRAFWRSATDIRRFFDRSHVEASNRLRGNASMDAPRPSDAERHELHSHAERGNDQKKPQGTLCVPVTRSVTS